MKRILAVVLVLGFYWLTIGAGISKDSSTTALFRSIMMIEGRVRRLEMNVGNMSSLAGNSDEPVILDESRCLMSNPHEDISIEGAVKRLSGITARLEELDKAQQFLVNQELKRRDSKLK